MEKGADFRAGSEDRAAGVRAAVAGRRNKEHGDAPRQAPVTFCQRVTERSRAGGRREGTDRAAPAACPGRGHL